MDEIELVDRADTSVLKLRAAADSVAAGTGYTTFRVPKRRGGTRLVEKAGPAVNKQQAAIKMVLDDLYEPGPPSVHGYVSGRNNCTNASHHLAQTVVLRVDLRSFFPSVESSRIVDSLSNYGLDYGAADLVVRLACVDGALATGFPTSPVLSNMVFVDTDDAPATMADDLGLNYTIYADDLAFSGPTINDDTLKTISGIVESCGWTVNDKKTRFMRTGGPQYGTGLYVGLPDRPRVPRRMERRMRQQLHYLEIYGYTDCHRRVPWTMGLPRIRGWLEYIARVEPELGEKLKQVAASVDFDLVTPIGYDDEWDVWLDEIGVPEDL